MVVSEISAIYLYRSDRRAWESKLRRHHILSLQLTGHYDHDFGDRVLPVRAGSLFFIHKDDAYTVKRREAGEALCVAFACDEPPRTAVYDVASEPRFENLFRKLYALRHIEIPETRCYAMAVLYELLGLLLSRGEPPAVRQGTAARIEAACRYIHAHYRDGELTNARLAAEAGLGVRRFSELFAECYHTTPAQYVIELRLQTAARLLSDGLSVTHTAHEVGFRDIYYFSRLFRRRFSIPPGRYAAAERQAPSVQGKNFLDKGLLL